MSAAPDESASAPVAYTHPWWVVGTLSLGSVAVVAGSSGIVGLLLPRMMAELGADIRLIQWIQTAFLIAMIGPLPAVGWLGNVMGQKRLYLVSLTIFTLGSLICPMVDNLPAMIGARVIQGVGASLIWPLSIAFIFDAFPPRRRGLALGVKAFLVTFGQLTGGLAAAHLSDLYSWRWGFHFIFVMGSLGVLMSSRILREPPLERAGRFDYLGSLFLILGLVSLILIITRRDGQVYFGGDRILLPALCALSAMAFLVTERRVREPMVDLSIYRYLPYLAGSLLNFILPASALAMFFLLPIYLQYVLGYTIFQTALLRAPALIAAGLVTLLSGWLSDRYDSRIIIVSGLLGYLYSLALLSTVSQQSSSLHLTVTIVIFGVSSGLCFTPLSNTMFSSLPHQKIRLGSGLSNLIKLLGTTLGTATIAVIFANRMTVRLNHIYDQMDALSAFHQFKMNRLEFILGGMGISEPGSTSPQILAELLQREAAAMAFGDSFGLLALCALPALIPVLFLRPKRSAKR